MPRFAHLLCLTLTVASLGLAQEPAPDNQQPRNSGWRRFSEAPRQPARSEDQRNYAAPPPDLTIRPGTFVTVRVNQPLSSDHNQQGDAFTATLVKPIVVDGIVVARRGETIAGRVTEAVRAGRISGASRLGIELTELTLADGSQQPMPSQMVSQSGSTSVGRDVGAIGATTAVGAAIGAGADYGRGAAIGAGAGAVAGIVGVLLTRGHETAIYPETVLTFRVTAPIEVPTGRAPQAFRYVEEGDYGPTQVSYQAPQPRPLPAPYYEPYWGGPYYGGWPYYGPSLGIYFGRPYPRGFYGRGYSGRGYSGHGYYGRRR